MSEESAYYVHNTIIIKNLYMYTKIKPVSMATMVEFLHRQIYLTFIPIKNKERKL